LPDFTASGPLSYVYRSIGIGKDLSSLVRKDRSGSGEFHVASRTRQQQNTYFLFQCLDLLAKRRLGNAQFFGCTPKVQFLRDLYEVSQMP
jgi:hypothetical protein